MVDRDTGRGRRADPLLSDGGGAPRTRAPADTALSLDLAGPTDTAPSLDLEGPADAAHSLDLATAPARHPRLTWRWHRCGILAWLVGGLERRRAAGLDNTTLQADCAWRPPCRRRGTARLGGAQGAGAATCVGPCRCGPEARAASAPPMRRRHSRPPHAREEGAPPPPSAIDPASGRR